MVIKDDVYSTTSMRMCSYIEIHLFRSTKMKNNWVLSTNYSLQVSFFWPSFIARADKTDMLQGSAIIPLTAAGDDHSKIFVFCYKRCWLLTILSQTKGVSISDWGDVLRTGSNGPPNTKGMSSHHPFDCIPKNVQFIRQYLYASYQLHHLIDSESCEQYQKAYLVI
jgi:hypothetical protein